LKRMFNKIIFIILFLFFVSGFNFVLAAQYDFKYPWSDAKQLGGSEGLIGKFYTFALAAVGVAALGAIIYGGILHTVSAGSASQQTEARAWIWGAVMGVMLLLGAYLLLNTINPELVKLTGPDIKPTGKIKKETEQRYSGQTTKTYYDLSLNECIAKEKNCQFVGGIGGNQSECKCSIQFETK